LIVYATLNIIVSATEAKIWIVPRIDSRNLMSHRHAPEKSFAHLTREEMPAFILHAKELWHVAFNNPNQQQPTRPIALTDNYPAIRFLGHSSILTGWGHFQQAIYQMGKV
jgi:hypothetical protein